MTMDHTAPLLVTVVPSPSAVTLDRPRGCYHQISQLGGVQRQLNMGEILKNTVILHPGVRQGFQDFTGLIG